MPPARKDPPDTNGASRPSTSRDFTPSLAPPVKRARTSTGGGPPPVRRQSTGGRQARMEEFIDEKELQERLLMAVTQTAGEILKEEEDEGMEKVEIESEVISAAAGIVWDALAEDWATDLIAFSRHAGRETIKEDDVKLLMRRNPDLLAEILEEMEEGDGSTTVGKRKSIGRSFDRRLKIPREDEIMELIDNVTTPRGFSSMTSVVPETPQGIVPLAHSTPMVGRSVSMLKAVPSFSILSPIGEEEKGGEMKREGSRPNRSILDDLSATMREEGEKNGERRGEETTLEDEDHFPPLVDLRHPREQEEEGRRMSMREDHHGYFSHEMEAGSLAFQYPGPSTSRQRYGRAESPELFGKSEIEDDKKEEEHDSFDDEIDEILVHEDEKNEKGGKKVDASNRMSESAALREMLDEEEEEKEKTVMRMEKEDSFDDDSIIFVDEKKEEKRGTPSPKGDFPSTTAGRTNAQQWSTAAPAAAGSTVSLRSSQDSFYHDEILADPLEDEISPSAASPTVQKPSTTTVAVQPIRAMDYDSFDDDDFVPTSSRSKENLSRAVGRSTPTNTMAMEEVVSSSAKKKHIVGAFAEDIFGLNSPTVSKPVSNPSTVKQMPVAKNGKKPSTGFSSFSFFEDASPSGNTPAVKREDSSDFVETSTRQTSAMRTPRGRGRGRGGRGFPRKIDPNSKVNRMIREQSTPVRISPRPPSRISEVVGSFEDEEFDALGFDD